MCLGDICEKYSHIAERYSIGLSTEGRQLWCVRISKDVTSPRQMLVPSVKYVANIHGDELVGRELLIGLARNVINKFLLKPNIFNE